MTQCSYRPHDMASFDYLDAKHDSKQALYSDEISPLWLYNQTTDNLFPIEKLSEQGNNADIAIVVESLQ